MVTEMENEEESQAGNVLPWTEDEKKGYRDGYVEGFLTGARLMKWIMEREHLQEPGWAYQAVLIYRNSVLLSWKNEEQDKVHPPYHTEEFNDPTMRQIMEEVRKSRDRD